MLWALLGFAIAFGAAGLGVIVTQGQNTWVPSNHWLAPLLFIVGGLFFLWYLMKVWRLRNAAPDVTPTEHKVNQKTLGIQSPAISLGSGTVHVNYGSSSISSTAATPGIGPPVIKARMECKARRARVEYVQRKACFTESLPDGTMAALIAFRNISGVVAKKVTASIEYEAGVDRQTVYHGCWLDESFSRVWIEPSMTKHLVVAVYSQGDKQYFTPDCQRHEVNDLKEPIMRRLDRHRHQVSVTVGLNGEDEKFLFVLDLSTEFQFERATS
jgi:hypothetical protein